MDKLMEGSRHRLVEINDISQLTMLRDMYKKDWPENYITYYSLDNCIRLSAGADATSSASPSSSSASSSPSDGNDNSNSDEKGKSNEDRTRSEVRSKSGNNPGHQQQQQQQQEQQSCFTVYSVDGDFSDGTFILFDNDEDENNKILFNSQSDNCDRLMQGLESLDQSISWYFPACTDKLKSVVNLFSERQGYKYEIDGPTIWYYLPKEIAIKFQIPTRNDVVLKTMGEVDASTVNEIWPLRYPGSINFVKRLIRNDYSVGAFDSSTGELMAWVLRLPFGELGMLQVKKEHYRKGLGKLVVMALCKRLAIDGHDVGAPVFTDNNPSRSLFRGLGFQEKCEMFWLERKTNL